MKYLAAEQVIFIHSVLISETGGMHGIRDLGLLESAIALPQATFEGQELYPDLFLKSAALLDSMVNNHPFVDGNKRTGITAAGIFLKINQWRLDTENQTLEDFTIEVASKHLPLEAIANWLRHHSRKIEI